MENNTKKTRKYGHITKVERHEMAILLKRGYSYQEIADELNRSKSSICYEIALNSVKGEYNAKKAHAKARNRRKEAKYQSMKILENRELENYIEVKMKQDWSPELIAGRIKYVEVGLRLTSHESIYKYVKSIYGRLLERHLAYQNKSQKKGRGHKIQDKLEGRIFIENRPEIINQRLRFGDWEGDLIVSGKNGLGALLVLYERRSRYVIIKRLLRVTPDIVNFYLRYMTGGILCVNSLTLDNDIAFRKHKDMSRMLGAPVYFCHPYHSWEKGGVENANKLIRRYVLKGSDISQYTDQFIQMAQDKLNDRPRKCLMFKTPNEIMNENHQLNYIKILVENEYKKIPLAFDLRV